MMARRQICVMMIARQSPMYIHDVAGKFTIYSTIHIVQVHSSLLSTFMMQNGNFRMHLATCFTHFVTEGVNFNRFSIRPEGLQKPVRINRDSFF
jgi:hypothetical protein